MHAIMDTINTNVVFCVLMPVRHVDTKLPYGTNGLLHTIVLSITDKKKLEIAVGSFLLLTSDFDFF